MKRIQRKRTKGWRMPDNTVYVGRPTKWGNPFVVGKPLIEWKESFVSIDLNKWYVNKVLQKTYVLCHKDKEASDVYNHVILHQKHLALAFRLIKKLSSQTTSDNSLMWYRRWILFRVKTSNLDLNELKGKNLACWCPLSQPCHADILIELVNTLIK